MDACLTITCGCGRSVSAPCPSLSDLLWVQQQFVGWAYDEGGRIWCPTCIAAGAIRQSRMPASAPDLFDEVAA